MQVEPIIEGSHTVKNNPVGPQQTNSVIRQVSETCHMHNEPAEYFCETCEELCCERCFYSGAHSSPLHIGRLIESIHKERVDKLRHNINRVIRIKEMNLNEKVRRLDKIYVHAKYIGDYFHNSTSNFFEGLVHQIRAESEQKRANVSKVYGSIQEDAHRITKVIFEANYLVSNSRHIDMLDNYNRLIRQAEYLYFKKHESSLCLTSSTTG